MSGVRSSRTKSLYSSTQSNDLGWYWNSLVLSQLVGWLNGLIAVRAPIAPKEPTVARATKQFSFMPKYLPVTTSGPTCEFLLRNNGPRIVDLTIRAPALSRMMPCRNAGSLLVFSKKSIEKSENFIAVRTQRRRSKELRPKPRGLPPDGGLERNYQPHKHAATFKEELPNQIYNPARCPPWAYGRAPQPDARDSDGQPLQSVQSLSGGLS